MTSARDFKLISWKNGLGLSGIVVAVLIPVGIRYYFRSDIAAIEDVEQEGGDAQSGEGVDRGGSEMPLEGVIVESGGPPKSPVKVKQATGTLILLDDDEEEEEGEDAVLQGIETDELPGSDKRRQLIDYKALVHRTLDI